MRSFLLWILPLLIGTICGCAPRSTFILLPSDDGRTSAIVVANHGGEQILDRPYQTTSVSEDGTPPSPAKTVSPEDINRQFSGLLATLPTPPQRFILHFVSDATLTPESQALLPEILEAIRARKSRDVSIIGHTDTSGSADYNYKLSRSRAEEVAAMLVALGMSGAIIQVDSHGENNLLFPTPDNTTEPRNRRVEVTVR